MPYTAEITGKKKSGGNALISARLLLDGVEVETFKDVPTDTPANFPAWLQKQIELREERDAKFDGIDVGPVQLPRDREPTEAEQAKAAADAFFVKLAALKALETQAAKGIIASDHASITAARAEVKAAFLPEYAADFRFG